MGILVISLIIIMGIVVNKLLIRKFKLNPKWAYKPVTKIQKRLEFIFILIIMPILYIIGFVLDYEIFTYNFLVMACFTFFRAFTEWKFAKATKQYIISIFNSCILLILFVSILFLTMPKEISYTHKGFIYSEDGSISEPTEMEITGQFKPNLIGDGSFNGQLNILNKVFYLHTIDNIMKDNYLSFRMLEINGPDEGVVLISRNFNTLAGNFETNQTTMNIVTPASTLEEGMILFEKIVENKKVY